MLFNSWIFVAFFLLTLTVYYQLGRRPQNVWLLLASYFFYGWWDWRFLALLAISTSVDYLVARQLAATDAKSTRRRLLLVSLVVNLGILGFFKYFNFFVETFKPLLEYLGLSGASPALAIVLPVGISFYTFQTMAYSIDVYRGKIEPCRDFVSFALYVSYFPQLVAGPIERPDRLIPALENRRIVDGDALLSGLFLILVGYVKKIAIADYLAGTVDSLFSNPGDANSLQLLIGVYAFALQIYCDFSGYTDIARGVSRLLGIELMVNFRQPYLASSITEFWRRWHISLSTWLRDYLYIPLGGSHYGSLKTYRNLFITMLLGGLWHGASWNFVVWGGLHGAYLAVHKLWLERSRTRPTQVTPEPARLVTLLRTTLGTLVTFHLVCFAWIFFRCRTFSGTLEYLQGLTGLSLDSLVPSLSVLHVLLSATVMWLLVDLPKRYSDRQNCDFASRPRWQLILYGSALVSFLLVFGDQVNVPFIYFQF